jgi:hypothetical protein
MSISHLHTKMIDTNRPMFCFLDHSTMFRQATTWSLGSRMRKKVERISKEFKCFFVLQLKFCNHRMFCELSMQTFVIAQINALSDRKY